MDLTLFQRNMFTTLILQLGKVFVGTGSTLSRCSLLANLVWCTHHLMSYALDGGKLLVPTLWNLLRSRCCALRPDPETRCCIVHTLLILSIDGDTASYLCSSELLKIWCSIHVVCTHLVKCYLNCVRNVLKGNYTFSMRLLEGSGIDYFHWRRLKELQLSVSESISKLIFKG
jgi:hypothetical protein